MKNITKHSQVLGERGGKLGCRDWVSWVEETGKLDGTMKDHITKHSQVREGESWVRGIREVG